MSLVDFNKLTTTGKYVLVDFNAKWCAPCQKMAPVLEYFVASRKDSVTLVKIDVDQNKDLSKRKGIDGIPYLELYHNGKLVWTQQGAVEENELRKGTKL